MTVEGVALLGLSARRRVRSVDLVPFSGRSARRC